MSDATTVLTPDQVRERVEEIRALTGDSEEAHSKEDALHQNVLHAIAVGACFQPHSCARIALETRGIDFARWYA